jgi:hypothetical protein
VSYMRHVVNIFTFLIFALPAAAQFTTVSGTVTDPNGVPYAGGTITAALVISASPTLNGLAYTPPTQAVGLSSNGSFLMQLADNSVLLPGGSQWRFTVCSAIGTVQPAFGTASQCFTAGPITISGASQSITATLNAAATALTLPFSGGGGITCSGPCTSGIVPVFTSASAVKNSLITSSATQVQIGPASSLLTNAIGIATVEHNNTLASCPPTAAWAISSPILTRRAQAPT